MTMHVLGINGFRALRALDRVIPSSTVVAEILLATPLKLTVGVVVSGTLERTVAALGTLLSNRPLMPVRRACRIGRGFPS